MDQHAIQRAREAYNRATVATRAEDMVAAVRALGDLLHALEMEERVRSAQNAVKP